MQSIKIGIGLACLTTLMTGPESAAQSACMTNADTAAAYDTIVTQIVTETDSSTLVSQGIPYSPAQGVNLVTQNDICSKVVAAYNSLYPSGDSRRITPVYVHKVGQNVYAAIHPTTAEMVQFFDTKYKWLAGMLQMK